MFKTFYRGNAGVDFAGKGGFLGGNIHEESWSDEEYEEDLENEEEESEFSLEDGLRRRFEA